jgi:hypothetical protein
MIAYTHMIKEAQDGKPHNFVFVAKGDHRRPGGYLGTIKQGIVSSSFHYGSSFNIISTKSGQVRKIYTILILYFDGKKVWY